MVSSLHQAYKLWHQKLCEDAIFSRALSSRRKTNAWTLEEFVQENTPADKTDTINAVLTRCVKLLSAALETSHVDRFLLNEIVELARTIKLLFLRCDSILTESHSDVEVGTPYTASASTTDSSQLPRSFPEGSVLQHAMDFWQATLCLDSFFSQILSPLVPISEQEPTEDAGSTPIINTLLDRALLMLSHSLTTAHTPDPLRSETLHLATCLKLIFTRARLSLTHTNIHTETSTHSSYHTYISSHLSSSHSSLTPRTHPTSSSRRWIDVALTPPDTAHIPLPPSRPATPHSPAVPRPGRASPRAASPRVSSDSSSHLLPHKSNEHTQSMHAHILSQKHRHLGQSQSKEPHTRTEPSTPPPPLPESSEKLDHQQEHASSSPLIWHSEQHPERATHRYYSLEHAHAPKSFAGEGGGEAGGEVGSCPYHRYNSAPVDGRERLLQRNISMVRKKERRESQGEWWNIAVEGSTMLHDLCQADERLGKFIKHCDQGSFTAMMRRWMRDSFSVDAPYDEEFIWDIHKDMILNRGLNSDHLDMVLGHLATALTMQGLEQEQVTSGVASLARYRPLFERSNEPALKADDAS